MKAKTVKIINFILAVLIALFSTGYAFAWFLEGMASSSIGFGGSSSGAYFADGDGSADNPFIINTKYHMYNLAWLQNTGRLIDAGGAAQKFYFEIDGDLEGDLDMEGLWLPPIGNDEYPFIGEFNGNGKTVSNLAVTTNKDMLSNCPVKNDATYAFSNAVGMFGMTGKGSVIRNFILCNPTVQAAVENANYADVSTSNPVIGLAVGHVAGGCSSIGVLAQSTGTTSLLVNKTGYSTYNSILGELGEDVSSSVTGGGHVEGGGGSGANFGSSFDVAGMYARLEQIEANQASSAPAWRLPNLGTASSTSITLDTLEKMPFAVSEASTYVGADAAEVVAANNIGYLLGNQNKVYVKNLQFGDFLVEDAAGNWKFSDGTDPSGKVFPRWIYRTTANEIADNVYSSANGFAPLTETEFDALPEGIRNLVPETSGVFEDYVSVRLSQTYNNAGIQIYPGSSSNGQWSPHGQISWMGKTYGEGFTMTDYSGEAVDENGIRYTAEGYKIDENGYMFNDEGYFVGNSVWPVSSGGVDSEGYVLDNNGDRCLDSEEEEIRYGGYEIGSDESGYYLIKPNGSILYYKDAWGGTSRLTPKTGTSVEFFRFEKGIALPNCGLWFKPAIAGTIRFVMYAESAGDGFALLKGQRTSATAENPFLVDYSRAGADVTVTEVGKYKLPAYVLFYFEFEVSEEDIAAGNVEYWLMQYGNGGAYFVYLDMGASGSDDDVSILVPEVSVSAVDFIYDGVSISQSDSEDGAVSAFNFVVGTSLYEPTRTSVYFEEVQTSLEIVFIRLYSRSDGKTMSVTVTSATDGEVKDSGGNAVFTFVAG